MKYCENSSYYTTKISGAVSFKVRHIHRRAWRAPLPSLTCTKLKQNTQRLDKTLLCSRTLSSHHACKPQKRLDTCFCFCFSGCAPIETSAAHAKRTNAETRSSAGMAVDQIRYRLQAAPIKRSNSARGKSPKNGRASLNLESFLPWTQKTRGRRRRRCTHTHTHTHTVPRDCHTHGERRENRAREQRNHHSRSALLFHEFVSHPLKHVRRHASMMICFF